MSTDRAALIAAIRETPDDDAPRLVCADWFEERGDEASVARAEFIRTQIERARLPVDDERQSELLARELRLLKKYGLSWCGSHFAFKKVRFRRGFIEYVHLHLQHFQHHRRQLFALEPVHNICLTGWVRSPEDLMRRVAACEEWRHIEALRIHHQGPHKDPNGYLMGFLSSPHLIRLRTLHMTHLEFDAEARRRFERLPVLRQLRDLVFPTLDMLMQHPGEWFSDGGEAHARKWGKLRSLTLPYYLRTDLLRRLMTMPWWDQLTEVSLTLPHDFGEILSTLQTHLPASLEVVRLLSSASGNLDFSSVPPLLDHLAQRPLRGLHLGNLSIDAATLRKLVDGTNPWALRELSLQHCGLKLEHVRGLASSPALAGLHFLDLSGNWDLDGNAGEALFAAGPMRSVVDLNLNFTRIGAAGAHALATAKGWDRLRSLDLSGVGDDGSALATLLASPNLQRLNWLTLGESLSRDDARLDISTKTARQITALPHLAALNLSVMECAPAVERHLMRSDSLAWPWIESGESYDDRAYRANRAPERWPPLDEAMERHAIGR